MAASDTPCMQRDEISMNLNDLILFVGTLTIATLVEENTIVQTVTKNDLTGSKICDIPFADSLFEVDNLDQVPGYALLDLGDIFDYIQDRNYLEKAFVLRHNNAISELLNCNKRSSLSSGITNEILDNLKICNDEG